VVEPGQRARRAHFRALQIRASIVGDASPWQSSTLNSLLRESFPFRLRVWRDKAALKSRLLLLIYKGTVQPGGESLSLNSALRLLIVFAPLRENTFLVIALISRKGAKATRKTQRKTIWS
jgi:hypothetical protein